MDRFLSDFNYCEIFLLSAVADSGFQLSRYRYKKDDWMQVTVTKSDQNKSRNIGVAELKK